MSEAIVPIVDLSGVLCGEDAAAWDAAAAEIGQASERIGFFIVSGHGIPAGLLEDAREAARLFFRLSDGEKRKTYLPGHGRGYIPFAAERLGATQGDTGPGDLKETFNVPCDFTSVTWPESPQEFRDKMEGLFREMRKLVELLMKLSATALRLARDYFDSYIDHPKATLRANYYPALTTATDPAQSRVSAHTDYGTLTILFPDDKVGGLQIQVRDGCWTDIQCPAGSFVINIGDLMEHWTNGKWRSTPHRVIIPESSDCGSRERLSIVFLHNPNPDAVIAPLPTCISEDNLAIYPSVRASDHLKEKSEKSRNLTGPKS